MTCASASVSKSQPAKRKTNSKKKGSKKRPILSVLVELEGMGITTPSREMVSAMSGYSKESLNTLMSKEKGKGYVVYPDAKTCSITPKGKAQVGGDVQPVRSNEEFHNRIKENFEVTGNPGRIFDILSDGMEHGRQQVMAALQCTNKGSFNTYLSKLRSSGLLEHVKGQNTTLQLTAFCFPFSRSGVADNSAGSEPEYEA
jgi:hypothetical protein